MVGGVTRATNLNIDGHRRGMDDQLACMAGGSSDQVQCKRRPNDNDDDYDDDNRDNYDDDYNFTRILILFYRLRYILKSIVKSNEGCSVTSHYEYSRTGNPNM